MQTSVFISPNSLLIECPINVSGGFTTSKNPFGTQMQLQNRRLIGIETFAAVDVANSPITTANPTIPATVLANAFLTLYTAAGKGRTEGLYYDQMPLVMMRRTQNNDAALTPLNSFTNDLFRIRPTEIAWTKSYVTIPIPIAIAVPYSALFLVHYLDLGDAGEKYE